MPASLQPNNKKAKHSVYGDVLLCWRSCSWRMVQRPQARHDAGLGNPADERASGIAIPTFRSGKDVLWPASAPKVEHLYDFFMNFPVSLPWVTRSGPARTVLPLYFRFCRTVELETLRYGTYVLAILVPEDVLFPVGYSKYVELDTSLVPRRP
jgi:hypothetical protein